MIRRRTTTRASTAIARAPTGGAKPLARATRARGTRSARDATPGRASSDDRDAAKERTDARATDAMSSDSDDASSSIDVECALETLLDPKLTGAVTKASVIELLRDASARALSETSDRCACSRRGCAYKKMVDCDELWWPRYAEAWYEPGMAPAFPGKAPKDKKSWKNAYLAAKPEDGPTAEEVARREAKVKKREEMLARWKEENLAGSGALRGRAAGVGDVVAPVDLSDKEAMRAFYKSVRAKPKGKSARGSHAPVFGAD